jgi:hypothetical protein
MNDSTTTFLKRLKGITLSNNERLSLRERLAAYADMHPLREGANVRSPFGSFFYFIESRRFSAYATALLCVIVLGGGVTLAADQSVPGDSLYSIKINVNEPVLTALTPTASGQAKIAAEIATRRVDEAVTLASRGTLTPARQAYLTTKFDASAKVAAVKAQELASTGNSEGAGTVTANFAANLAGEAQALGAVTTKDSSQSADLLRVVIATSESISGGATDESVVTVTVAGSARATATTTVTAAQSDTHIEHASLMMAKSAILVPATTTSPTPTTATSTVRFSKHLRVNADTLRTRLLSPSLEVLAPKVDVAIPHTPSNLQGNVQTVSGESSK